MKKIDFIAEVSSNHNRDLYRMKDFIYASKKAGCSGVKFQLFKIDQLFSSEILSKSEIHRKRKDWELPEKYIPELAELCHSLNLKFSCTPFYLGAVDILEPYVDFYKIASYELLWHRLFEKCGNTGKPVIFSTGMAMMDEVEDAIKCLLKTKSKNITILHCNSAYPTPVEDANLAGINVLKEMISKLDITDVNIKIGYSDHTVSEAVLFRAVHHYNIDFLEFHLDLDGKGEEYKSGHCWLPAQISEVISNINSGFMADGNKEFKPSSSEMPDRDWRADPTDGLRPLKNIRETFNG
ncbi:MAG: N-acetylneuraminate synthase family protein [Bacteroidetes bacterium]|nr:N-acetylneuraminate synthase family protein [Bacteroidota bacterium]